MIKYTRPDVYIERYDSQAPSVDGINANSSIAGMVGIAPRGVIGEAVLVKSFPDFISKYARGLDTPYSNKSDLAYAVNGFFQNGGTEVYIARVAGATAEKATATIGTDEVVLEALEEGTWGNKLKAEIVTGTLEQKDLVIFLNGEIVESFPNVVADVESANYLMNRVNGTSKFVTIKSVGVLAVNSSEFTLGADGIDDIEDTDYLGENGLMTFKEVDETLNIAIPGQTSDAIVKGMLDYCEETQNTFAVIETPMGSSVEEAEEFRLKFDSNLGAVYHPWGVIADPINKGIKKVIPPSGHILGVYARTDKARGVHKAPAGIEAQLKGFVELESKLKGTEIGDLNEINVNCLMPKKNKGIVVWGARLISPDLDRVYVSDARLDINLESSLSNLTQWTVFEPNGEQMWNRVEAEVKAFMGDRYSQGAFQGEDVEEAFYVKCDKENNTQETMREGRVVIEVGYAKTIPNEFTVFRLSQKTLSN